MMSKEDIAFLTEEEQQEVKLKFLGFRQGLVGVGPIRHLLPSHCTAFTKKYQNFKFCESDVVIATFPRSGTTWTQEIVWTMRNGLDFKTASNVSLNVRSPFFEFDSIYAMHKDIRPDLVAKFLSRHPDGDPKTDGLFLELAEMAPSPRTIKTHLPFSLLPPDILETCKVVYVARNPRDVCVSYYHHQTALETSEFIGDFPDFVDLWCRDLYLQAPFWGHLKEALAKRQHRNLLFLFYEDMKENLMRELKRLNAFLGTGLTEEQLQQVAEHTSIGQMKNRPSVNPPANAYTERARKEGKQDFIRKGTIGDWVNYFTPELETKFQAWLETGGEVAGEISFKYHAEQADTLRK
ncbi:sulfotransferase family cytosolic 1B member 1-like isoform X2 [Portunus trituberculatus]|nr:sulfotransferase family cytosolic 1B member 1-like isoform X2 [Portunus trituberculatus]XP_045102520.1 sulfotransferase family cytosolic 1B member 1-like isoform X2 [Portunus trituberculatus]